MQKIFFKQLNTTFYYIFLCILLLIRIYQLSQSAPFDYDSVYNFQILEQIAQKNYQNVFHHASPVFYAVFSLFYAISSDFWFLLYSNALIGTLAVHIFVATFSKHNIIFLLLLGLSLLLVASSRYLSIESISLMGSALLWSKIKSFFEVSKNYSEKNQNLTSLFPIHYFAIFFAFLAFLLLLSNYKAIVPLFFGVVGILILSSKSTILHFRVIVFALIYFAIGMLLVMLLGILLGQKWYQYPATFLAIVFSAKNTSASTWDFGYYFKYILSFENPFLLIFLPLTGFNFIKKYSQTEDFTKLLWFVFLGTFLVMSALAKAPRGLILCLPLGYYLVFDWAKQYFHSPKPSLKLFALGFLGASIYLQFSKIKTEIYNYSSTNYSKVARYLHQSNAQVVFSTLGLGLYPYLDKSTKLVVLREDQDTLLFRQYTGNKFLLYDVYGEVSNHQTLFSLKNTKFDTTFREPSLVSPMLYLESSQYNGFTFSQSIEKAENAQKEPFQIGIKKIKTSNFSE